MMERVFEGGEEAAGRSSPPSNFSVGKEINLLKVIKIPSGVGTITLGWVSPRRLRPDRSRGVYHDRRSALPASAPPLQPGERS